MAKGRELKGRIKSVENTRKITRTMEMVATSKMKRAQDRVTAARPYANALAEVISSLYSPDLAERFPLLRQPATVASRRGDPADVEPRARRRLQREPDQGGARAASRSLERRDVEVELHVVGKKGIGYFRYVGRAMASQRTDITDRPTAEDARVARRRADGPSSSRARSTRCTSSYAQVQLGALDAAARPSRSCR